jgi:DNA repair protein RecO (recombination protein O)
MRVQVHLQPTYVLHYRPYRDTSLLVDLFTQDHGRITAVAKGARANRSRLKGFLQPFVPLLTSWIGKTELVTLTHAEASGPPPHLKGDGLLSGFYLNEVLLRVLERHDAYSRLYQCYHGTLLALQNEQLERCTLRYFEKHLLIELGYGIDLSKEAGSHSPILPDQYYIFDPQQGLSKSTNSHFVGHSNHHYLGEHLLAIHADNYSNPEVVRESKRLLKTALSPLLGNKPLKSRELFMDFKDLFNL